MGKPTGFLEYERKVGECAAPLERIKNFREFHGNLPKTEQQLQGARCMACLLYTSIRFVWTLKDSSR